MSHFARKLVDKLANQAVPKADYPQHWPMQVNNEPTQIAIKYTRRNRSIGLKYLQEGWKLYCPQNVSPKKVRSMLQSHHADLQAFIDRHSSKIHKRAQQQNISPLQKGSEFIWLGQKCQIECELAELERELIKEAQDYLHPKVAFYAEQMQLAPKQIKVKNYKSCWGNCYHQRGLVQFNWKLLQAPEWVVDYVIVHELAHLVHPNHSRDFWSLVQYHYPQTPQAKSYLKQYGGHMMKFYVR
ncbi:M48 family metallopeptidase [Thiomicrorhabdus xiamenensis]|uniref:M48 family metallopeptidase n=1 Tax=Thiomicrorhabdus xiamenensis TaxID=2739063 RepID=A0A7D4SRR6_9GAMM|nr:M48 family metallopeptidase [Thiomicrorhabdus xiamenensis]QKI88683.1 M48 family metallopeptidase [Thiomicrorhabdus xiamenensis]